MLHRSLFRNFWEPFLNTIQAFTKNTILFSQVHFRLDFIMKANTMKPDQIASKGAANLGSYYLQCRLANYLSR